MKAGGRYRKGANIERKRVQYHYKQGALLAARTAGSHGQYDVVALYPGNYGYAYSIVLEQLKTRKHKLALHPKGSARVHFKQVLYHRGKWVELE